jgi:putative membrane protein
MNPRRIQQCVALVAVALAGPALAVSLSTSGPGQPIPEPLPQSTPVQSVVAAVNAQVPGSASLVPLMAVDTPSSRLATVDAPAVGSQAQSGRPLDDVGFVKQAAESGRKEVNAARDALPRLKRPELKRIAQMLVEDHSGANSRLAQIAAAKGWPVSEPAARAQQETGTASGDFDARFLSEMIAGHERSVSLYRSQAETGDDADLRKYARDTLPTIQHHLDALKGLQ